jgi:glycosyltransferase involved in cell wall biosynthesis/2-polyprenyl-3-methyl-5-hydroxy-6-metoxy-1,4-benzoquinol methylase
MPKRRTANKDSEVDMEFHWDDFWPRAAQRQRFRSDVRFLEVSDSAPIFLRLPRRPPWFYSLIGLSDIENPTAAGLTCEEVGRSADEIVPQVFDEIWIHFWKPPREDPVKLLYSLFRRGFVREKTFVTIVLPTDAVFAASFRQAREWLVDEGPPNPSPHDLLYAFLEMLRFTEISIREKEDFVSSGSEPNKLLLLAEGQKSDFAEFMQERYVPGTWTELSDYEHIPRYLLASRFASGKRVLDFACGVGFGSYLIAEKASSLLGVDISKDALRWGNKFYRRPNLHFAFNDDLAATLPPKSVDLVICFEVIEHLETEHQGALLKNFCQLLYGGGLLLISTPNPKATELYNSNPFHLAELRRDQFESLLRSHFRFVVISEQRAQHAVLFSGVNDDQNPVSSFFEAPGSRGQGMILNWLAVCSNESPVVQPNAVFVNLKTDLIRDRILSIREGDELRLKSQELAAQLRPRRADMRQYQAQVNHYLENQKWSHTIIPHPPHTVISRQPLISVIVPSYNHARYLGVRLHSIFDQTFTDFELIFLDDASTDESVALAKEIAAGRPMKIVLNEKNSGSPFLQWNKGIAFSRGEFLWIAESDDYSDSHFLQQMISMMEKNDDVSIAYCQSWLVDSEDKPIESVLTHTADIDPHRWQHPFVNSGREELKRYLCLRNTIPNASACLLRKAALAEIGLAPTHLRQCGDWLTWVRILEKGNIAYTPEHLNFYRVHSGTIRKQMERAALELIEVYEVQNYIKEKIGLDEKTLERARTLSFNRWLWLGANTWSGPADLLRHGQVLQKGLRFDPRIPYRILKEVANFSSHALRLRGRQKY